MPRREAGPDSEPAPPAVGSPMKKTVLTTSVLLLLLSGCTANPATAPMTAGATPDPAQTATDPVTPASDAPSVEGFTDAGSGMFAFVIDQATGDVTLPAPAPDDVEALRDELGEDPVTYAVVSVQNPDDAEILELESILVSTPEGQELQFRPAPLVLEEWGASANGGEPSSEVVELVEEYSGGALPDTTTELLMIGQFPELPDTVSSVVLQPGGGGEPVEAQVRPES